MSTEAESRSAFGRSLRVADNSGVLDDEPFGGFQQDAFAIIYEFNSPNVDEVVEGPPEPRNWHLSSMERSIVPGLPNVKDVIDLACISDYEHPFEFIFSPPPPNNPWGSDFAAENRSTRVVDYETPKGNSALMAQGWKVIDSCGGDFTVGIPHGPTIKGQASLLPLGPDPNARPSQNGGFATQDPAFSSELESPAGNHGGDISAGYTWDGIRTGLLSTLWHPINPDDVFQGGINGTECGMQGLRSIAHWEWGEKHGGLRFSKTNLRKREGRGPIFSAALRHMPEEKNNPGVKESGKWAPYYRMVYFTPEENGDAPNGDHLPPGEPGGPGDPTGFPKGDDVVPPTDPCPDPVDGGPWPDPDDDGVADDPTPMWLVLPGMLGVGGFPLFVPLDGAAQQANIVNLTKQGYLGMTTGQGPGGDKTVVWTARDGTPVAAGFTVPFNTTVGLSQDQQPGFSFGDDLLLFDSDYWDFYQDSTGDFQLDNFSSGSRFGSNVVNAGQQFQVRGSGFDLEYTPTPLNFWSWNMELGFNRVPELSTAPLGGATFSGLEYRILDGSKGFRFFTRYRDESDSVTVEHLWHDDALNPILETVDVDAVCLRESAVGDIPTPPAGSEYVFLDVDTGDISAKDSGGGKRSLEGGAGAGDAGDVSVDSLAFDNLQEQLDWLMGETVRQGGLLNSLL